ncbi:hypothetical protein [Cerasicoccus fimbriatus]|uniref:hypothetical protein n=1 Tax=Cerasicoccus fimbriatus TaxID=3014554 RepID=UPI0022B47C98|nr:hypothetical protein [Cerasicoccus sp. TK19100]
MGVRYKKKRSKLPLILAALVLLVLLAVAALWFSQQWKPSTETVVVAETETTNEDSGADEEISYDGPPRNLEELIERYAATQGGPEKISQIKSLRLRGEIIQGDQPIEFQQIKRRPNMSRVSLETPLFELITTTNGDQVWRQYAGRPEIFEVTGVDRERVLSDSRIVSPLWTERDNPGALTMLSDEMDDGVLYHRIKVALPNRPEAIYWLDPETYLEHQITSTNSDDKEVVTRFGDYRKLGWLTIPYNIHFIIDGDPTMEIQLEKAEMNIGVFESFFDPPEMTGGEWPPKSPAGS